MKKELFIGRTFAKLINTELTTEDLISLASELISSVRNSIINEIKITLKPQPEVELFLENIDEDDFYHLCEIYSGKGFFITQVGNFTSTSDSASNNDSNRTIYLFGVVVTYGYQNQDQTEVMIVEKTQWLNEECCTDDYLPDDSDIEDIYRALDLEEMSEAVCHSSKLPHEVYNYLINHPNFEFNKDFQRFCEECSEVKHKWY